jgi:hypothetical protein
MNALIRAAAGRRTPELLPVEEPEPLGAVGIGLGGTAASRRLQAPDRAAFNQRLRAAAKVARAYTVPGGVTIDSANLDGPW